MSIRQTTGQVPTTRAPEPKKMDIWTNLAKIAKFASSYSKVTDVSDGTKNFLKNVSEHLGAITSIEKLLAGDAPVFDTMGKISTLNSLRELISKDFTGLVESEVYKLWAKYEPTVSKEASSLTKTAMSTMQGISKPITELSKRSCSLLKTGISTIQEMDKLISKPLSDLSKNLSALPIYGHMDKLDKAADALFVHPEEHRGETEEAAVSFTSAALGIASVVLPMIMKVPVDVSNGMSATSAFLGLVEQGNKTMLSPLDKNKRDAKNVIREDFKALKKENDAQNLNFRKSNPDHEYNKQFRAFHKQGTAKDLNNKLVLFQGMQSFYDRIDGATSSEEVSGIMEEYLEERNQLDMPKGGKGSAVEKTEAGIQKLRKKMDGPTA